MRLVVWVLNRIIPSSDMIFQSKQYMCSMCCLVTQSIRWSWSLISQQHYCSIILFIRSRFGREPSTQDIPVFLLVFSDLPRSVIAMLNDECSEMILIEWFCITVCCYLRAVTQNARRIISDVFFVDSKPRADFWQSHFDWNRYSFPERYVKTPMNIHNAKVRQYEQ